MPAQLVVGLQTTNVIDPCKKPNEGLSRKRHCHVIRQPHSQRQIIRAAADPPSVSGFFKGLLAPRIRPADPLLQAAEAFRQAIANPKPNEAELAGYVETLLTATRSFEEVRLGGGPWQVVYSRGPLLWKGWVSPGKLANIQNRASQDFDPSRRTVVNRAEIFGDRVFVTADGTYEPQGDVSATPVEVLTNVRGATLHFFDRRMQLPIRGQGTFFIMYADDSLRLLRNGNTSTSSLVVQIRADVLEKLLARQRT